MHSYFGSATYYGDNTLIRFQTFGNIEKTYQAWNGVPSIYLDSDRTYNPCGEYEENGVKKFYDNQTDNYRQQNYHLMASQRLSDLWNMNLTLHYTHGEGYYEDYKPNEEFTKYKLPGVLYQRERRHNRQFRPRPPQMAGQRLLRCRLQCELSLRTSPDKLRFSCHKYVGDHFGRVMWVKNAEALPRLTTNITVTEGTNWIITFT